MSLVAVSMLCGQGTRFTDSIGGCNSYAFTTINTDSRFRGPKFSIMYRLKLVSGALTAGGCRVGIADFNGTATRQHLDVTVASSVFHLLPILDTTACGFQIVTDVSKTKDTTEHSVAWTYDGNVGWQLYWDGVQVDSGPSLCVDISDPSAIGDMFQIAGSTDFAGVEVFDIDRVMYANDVLPAAQIASIHTNCGSF